jgi:hypothetical protein
VDLSSLSANVGALGEPVGQVIAILAAARREVDHTRSRASRIKIASDPLCSRAARAVTVHHHRDLAASEQPSPLGLPGMIARNRDSRQTRASGR